MINMNVEWNNQSGQRHTPVAEPKSFLGGLFTLNKKEEEERRRGHTSRSSSSRPSTPRRAETISVLPPGVKMPTGNQPQLSYGSDGSKYLVIPRRSNSSSRPRQIILTSGHASPSPRRMDSSGGASRHETRSPPHRSSSTSRPLSPPHRAPKIVGDPELVKQYENSQRNVARWVEAVGSPTSGRPTPSKRNTTR